MDDAFSEDFLNIKQQFNNAAMRPVTKFDVDALANVRPYLELACCFSGGEPYYCEGEVDSLLFDSASYGVPINLENELGWGLQYWPAGISWPGVLLASPSDQVFYGEQPVFSEAKYKVGTILAQAVEMAVFMVGILKYQQWQGIKIINGDVNMQWAAWLAADYHNIPLYGFQPTEEDLARKQRSLPNLTELLSISINLNMLGLS